MSRKNNIINWKKEGVKYLPILKGWEKLSNSETTVKRLLVELRSNYDIKPRTYYYRVKKLKQLGYISEIDGFKTVVIDTGKICTKSSQSLCKVADLPKPKVTQHYNKWFFDMSRFKNWNNSRNQLLSFKSFIPSKQLKENNIKPIEMRGGWSKIDGYLDLGSWGRFYVLTSHKGITLHLPRIFGETYNEVSLKVLEALDVATKKLSKIFKMDLLKDGWTNCYEKTRELEFTNSIFAKYILKNKIKVTGDKYSYLHNEEGLVDTHIDNSLGTPNIEANKLYSDPQGLENFVNSQELLKASCGSDENYFKSMDNIYSECGNDPKTFLSAMSNLKNSQSEGVLNIPKEFNRINNNFSEISEAVSYVNNKLNMVTKKVEESLLEVGNHLNSFLALDVEKSKQIETLANATGNLAKISSNHESMLVKLSESKAVAPKPTENKINEFNPRDSSMFM